MRASPNSSVVAPFSCTCSCSFCFESRASAMVPSTVAHTTSAAASAPRCAAFCRITEKLARYWNGPRRRSISLLPRAPAQAMAAASVKRASPPSPSSASGPAPVSGT